MSNLKQQLEKLDISKLKMKNGNSVEKELKEHSTYTVRLGVSVIESAAFLNCRYLEEIKYNGQQKDWDKIKIGANNTSLTSLEIKFLTSVK